MVCPIARLVVRSVNDLLSDAAQLTDNDANQDH
jgi:hypothetical protein